MSFPPLCFPPFPSLPAGEAAGFVGLARRTQKSDNANMANGSVGTTLKVVRGVEPLEHFNVGVAAAIFHDSLRAAVTRTVVHMPNGMPERK